MRNAAYTRCFRRPVKKHFRDTFNENYSQLSIKTYIVGTHQRSDSNEYPKHVFMEKYRN